MAVTRAIELRTEVPGPRSREIVERKKRVVAAPLSLVHPVVAAEGGGGEADGRRGAGGATRIGYPSVVTLGWLGIAGRGATIGRAARSNSGSLQ